MPVREHAAFLTKNNSKMGDDAYIHFGTKDGLSNFTTFDRRLGYDSAEQTLVLECYRESATSPAYAYGLVLLCDGMFTGTGARKQFGLYIAGSREDAVMGGDAHDMLLKGDYTNSSVNTPAGSYARGFSFTVQNHGSGAAIGRLEGGFISATAKHNSAAIVDLRGLQVDTNLDVGSAACTGLVEGLRVQQKFEANCPAHAAATGGYGIVIEDMTDGVYSVRPAAALAIRNRGTSSHAGYTYGFDLYDSRAKSCTYIMRFPNVDAGALPAIWACGAAADDTAIVAQIGASSLWADGSLYSSILDGSGKLFIKVNDTWTSAI